MLEKLGFFEVIYDIKGYRVVIHNTDLACGTLMVFYVLYLMHGRKNSGNDKK